MAEILTSKSLTVEKQIHISSIVIAAPIGQELSATVGFACANVDDDGNVYPSQWEESFGPQQLSLNQDSIVGLLGAENFAQVREDLHATRTSLAPTP